MIYREQRKVDKLITLRFRSFNIACGTANNLVTATVLEVAPGSATDTAAAATRRGRQQTTQQHNSTQQHSRYVLTTTWHLAGMQRLNINKTSGNWQRSSTSNWLSVH
jgi:hypothetical protein